MKKRTKFIIGGAAVIATVAGLALRGSKEKTIVSPLKIRKDAAGNGNFGASRTGGYVIHNGIDLVVEMGQPVYAPFSGTVIMIDQALKSQSGYKGVKILTDTELIVDVLYIIPTVAHNDIIKKVQLIGHAQDIRQAYPNATAMLNHIHVEHWDKNIRKFVNPTSYYFPSVTGSIDSEPIIENPSNT